MSDVKDFNEKEEFQKIYEAQYAYEKPQEAPEGNENGRPQETPANTPDAPAEAPEKLDEHTEEVPPTQSEAQPTFNLDEEYNKLHPELKKLIDQERRAQQSAVGRVAFLNRELDLLKNELKSSQPQVQKTNEHMPKVNETPAEKKARLQKLEELRKNDPEYAATIDELLEEWDRRHVEEVSRWKEQVTPLQQHVQTLELTLEETRLDSAVNDWREIVNSGAFAEWSHYRMHPAERERFSTTGRAADMIPYLVQFKQDWAAYQASLQPNEQPRAPASDTSKADKVAQDRANKLQTASVGPTSVPKPSTKAIDFGDPDAMRREFERVYKRAYET